MPHYVSDGGEWKLSVKEAPPKKESVEVLPEQPTETVVETVAEIKPETKPKKRGRPKTNQ